MGLRPGHCYSKNVKKRAYARSAKKVHRRNYVGGIPGSKIRQFHMGFGNRPYTHVIHYVTTEKIQIRDNALESVRTTIVRQLNKQLTQQNFYMKLRVDPQFYLRENKQAQGAHADRIQQGMSQCPFGKVVGRASRVRVNKKIYSILVDEQHVPTVKKILSKVSSKLPGKMKIVVEENKDSLKSVGTVKKRTRLLKAAAKASETDAKASETPAKDSEVDAKVSKAPAKDSKAKEKK